MTAVNPQLNKNGLQVFAEKMRREADKEVLHRFLGRQFKEEVEF